MQSHIEWTGRCTFGYWNCNEQPTLKLCRRYEMLCGIWYQLYYLKNVENTHGGVLLLVKFQALACNFTKNITPPRVFLTFFKLCKWYQIAQSITAQLPMLTLNVLTHETDILNLDKDPENEKSISKIANIWRSVGGHQHIQKHKNESSCRGCCINPLSASVALI